MSEPASRSLLGLFPLPLVLLPGMPLPLHIFEPRYRELVAECLAQSRPFGVLQAATGELADVGCSAHIERVLRRHDDGRLDILTRGGRRFRVERWDPGSRSFAQGEVSWLEDPPTASDKRRVDLRRRYSLLHAWAQLPPLETPTGQPQLSWTLGRSALLGAEQRQQLLECDSERERLARLERLADKLEPGLQLAGCNGHGQLRADAS